MSPDNKRQQDVRANKKPEGMRKTQRRKKDRKEKDDRKRRRGRNNADRHLFSPLSRPLRLSVEQKGKQGEKFAQTASVKISQRWKMKTAPE